jgi:DNA-binding response OmpR family regulator
MRVLVMGGDHVVRDHMRMTFDARGIALRWADYDACWDAGPPDYDVVFLQPAAHQAAVRWSRIVKRRRGAIPLMVGLRAFDSVAACEILDAGADDVVPLSIPDRELVARLRALHRRWPQPPGAAKPRCRRWGTVTFDLEHGRLYVDGHDLNLRRAEFRLLEYLTDNAGRLITARELTERALGGRHVEGSNLIRVHLAHLRRKLGDLHEAIQTIHGVEYVLVAPPATLRAVADEGDRPVGGK